MEGEQPKYTAPKLFLLGVLDGIKILPPIKWIKRHSMVRESVAVCVFCAGVAFLAAMALAELLKSWFPSLNEGTLRVLLMYMGSMAMQNVCAPRHKTIAAVLQQKTQHSIVSLPPECHTMEPPPTPSKSKKTDAQEHTLVDKPKKVGGSKGGADEGRGINGLLELTQSVAEMLYRTVLYGVCICEGMTLALIPWGIGWLSSVLFYSWIYTFNCLLIKWARFKWPITRALAEFRVRAVYYLGLGLPFSLLCRSFSSLTNVMLFCTLYPVYEIIIIRADDGDKKISEPLPVFALAQRGTDKIMELLVVLKQRLLELVAKTNDIQAYIKKKFGKKIQ